MTGPNRDVTLVEHLRQRAEANRDWLATVDHTAAELAGRWDTDEWHDDWTTPRMPNDPALVDFDFWGGDEESDPFGKRADEHAGLVENSWERQAYR